MSDDEANLAHVFQNQSNLRGYMAGAIARQSEIDGADTDARVGAWAQAASTAVSAVPLPQTKAAGVALDAGTKFALNAGKSAAAQGAESGIGSLFGGHEDKAKSENEKARNAGSKANTDIEVLSVLGSGVYTREELAAIAQSNKGVGIASVLSPDGDLLIIPDTVDPDNPALTPDQKNAPSTLQTPSRSAITLEWQTSETTQESTTGKDMIKPTIRSDSRGRFVMRPTQQRHPRNEQTGPEPLTSGPAGTARTTRRGRARALSLTVAASVLLTGCGFLRPGAATATATAAAPPSVDPATTDFTCPGLPDTSVKAVFSSISLSPTTIRETDGSVRQLDCWGNEGNGDGTTLFFSEFGRETPNHNSHAANRGPGSESFTVPGIEGATGDIRMMSDGQGGSSLITCGDAFILVRMYSHRAPMRGDLKENVKNLALSMTPWACNGETIPGLGMPLSPAAPTDQAPTDSQPSETPQEQETQNPGQ